MQSRLDFYKASPTGTRAMMALEKAVSECGLEKPLMELVRLRASQINGCAFCVDMHTTDARKGGETGAKRHSSANANAQRSNGRKRSRWLPRLMCRMQCGTR
jgi:AhpD family alkylhydroperoxidase